MSQPVVCVEQGKLLGKITPDIHGKNFYRFQGIPYAKPPVGKLRFKAPQPPQTFPGIRNATEEASECYHKQMITGKIVGSEDCLYLNVFTPQLPTETSKELKPVMVWIHGGGFRWGSSKTDHYGPEYLLTGDVVLVTINYRLGIFGFLHLEDPTLDICCNAGLKDMVMALKWVQKNIINFSGDPNNVTIFGQSAGGSAVHYLILSPLAEGLFHKAIAQSGCALSNFGTGKKDISSQLALVLDLPNASEWEILNYVSGLSTEKLFEVFEKVNNLWDPLNHSCDVRPFAPIIEKPSDDAFIADEPVQIMKTGKYNQVPMVFGYTTREGMLLETMIKPRKATIPEDFETLVPFKLKLSRGSEASKDVASKIKEFYYGDPATENDIDRFYLLHTDSYLLRDIMFTITYHAKTSSWPIFLYRMSIDTSLNLFKKLGRVKTPGVSHGDDIAYLFKTRASPKLKAGSLEDISVQRFVSFWTNFAKYGNPNGQHKAGDAEWKPIEEHAVHFLDIGEKLTTGINPDQDRVKFWTDIFSNYST